MVTIPKLLISLILVIPLLACQEEEPAKQIGSGPAQLQLQLADLRYEFVDGRHKYFHKRKYTESIGTGVTLQAGKVCVERGKACLSARVNYRIDGTVSSFSTFYPAEEGESPALKLEGSFGLDGVSLEWEKRYLEDGSLSRSGKRLSSGDYLVQNYESVDNVMVAAAKQVFDAQGNEYETVEFFADGGISKLVMVTEEKGTETTTFTVDGKRVTYHSIKYANIVWLT